jgi:hypothetical protein
VLFRSVPPAHTVVRGVDGWRLRRHSADSTLPPLWPTGSSSGWLPSIAARSFSSCPSDSTSRWTPCPPRHRLPRPARHYSRLRIWRPPSERQWDFNPPEHVAAQRTLWAPPTPASPVPHRDRDRVAPAARQASRVASHRVRTCCAHYPGEQGDLRLSVYPIAPDGLRLMRGAQRGDSALASNLSGPAQASLALRPVRSLTRPRRIFVPGAPTVWSPSPSPG